MGFWKNLGNRIMSEKFKEKFGDLMLRRAEEHWLLNMPERVIFYNAKSVGNINIVDVFKMTAIGEKTLQAVADRWKDFPNDEKIIAIAKYVNRRTKYIRDFDNFNRVEFWADPYTVWENKFDDCDGYSVLIAQLGWMAGIPRSRLWVKAQTVYDPYGNYGGGHANCMYLREADNEWYTIEGSWYAATTLRNYENFIAERENKMYGRIWWATTDKVSHAVPWLDMARFVKRYTVDQGPEFHINH